MMTRSAITLLLVTALSLLAVAAVGEQPPPVAENESALDLGPAEGESSSPEKSHPAEPSSEPTNESAPDAAPGRIEGTVLPADRVRAIRLVNRAAGKTVVAPYNRKAGTFAVEDLSPGVWAVEIETPWGKVEGVDARFRPADVEKAAPRKPGEKPPTSKPLDKDDRAEIRRHIVKPERFMTPRVLAFVGDGRRVTVLVSLLRDRAFHKRKGDEVIWRLETWYYEDAWGHWERVGYRVVFRRRLSGATLRTWTRQFEPTLGGLEITSKTVAPIVVRYTVPELPSRSRGLVAKGQKATEDAAEKAPRAAPADK